jgi:sec-independent protein translocase protein TatA
MFGIGLMELLTILVLATLVMGPEGMVKFAGQLGQWLAKFRRETEGVTKEFKEAFNLELNPKEFTDALDLGLDPKDPLGLKQVSGSPAAKVSPATTRQWNLPAASAVPSAASTQGADSAFPVTDEPDADGEIESEPSLTSGQELYELPEPTVVDTSPDAEAVTIGIAEWVPEDSKAEATVIGEPLWVDAPDETEALEADPGDSSMTVQDEGKQESAHSEEVA